MPEEYEEDKEYYGNSMEIGGDIHQQSDVVKKFIHLPKDTKYSFFDRIDKVNYYYKSSAYQTYHYVNKILRISREEIKNFKADKKKIFDCKCEEDLKAYFKKNKKNYLWNFIKDLKTDERKPLVDAIINQLKTARVNGFVEDMYSEADNFNTSYNNYIKLNPVDNGTDDIGLLNTMMTTTEVSKAYKGQGIKSMNTTININKDVSPEEDAEEEPEETEGQKFQNKFFKKRN